MLRRSLQFALALVLAALVINSAPYSSAIAKEKCIAVGQKKVCFEDGKNKTENDDGDDDDDDKPKEFNKALNCAKARCEPGMVVLDKPNQYGACCEAREGLPPPKTAAEPEKCQFPGEVGTPPNCTCPPGTEFMGYRGCLPKKADPVGPSPKKVVQKNCCTGKYPNGDSAGRACGGDEAALRKIIAGSRQLANPDVSPSIITCAPEK